jgi:hypothetical protein
MEGLSQELLHERNVRIGVVDVFTAPEGTPENDQTGKWVWEGVIEAGSESYDFPAEMFELKTGHPNTTKVQAVIGRDGTVGFTFDEYTARAVDLAAGGAPTTKDYGASPAPDTVAAAPAPTTTKFTLETAGAGIVIGQRIEVETANGLEDTYIEDYDEATGEVTVKPALSAAPAAGNDVKWIRQYVKPIGGFAVPKKALKTVFTDRNGEQAIIYVPCVSSVGNYQPNFADARSNAKIPVQLRAYGKEVTLDGKKQPIVAYHYLRFPGVS